LGAWKLGAWKLGAWKLDAWNLGDCNIMVVFDKCLCNIMFCLKLGGCAFESEIIPGVEKDITRCS